MTIPPVAASDPRNWLLSQPQLIFLLFVGAVWLFKLIARARTSVSDAARGPQPAQLLEVPAEPVGQARRAPGHHHGGGDPDGGEAARDRPRPAQAWSSRPTLDTSRSNQPCCWMA